MTIPSRPRVKILIAAGSSGGHIFPAIATSARIRELERESEIVFVGAAKEIDRKIFEGGGFGYQCVSGDRKIFRDLSCSFRLLRTFKPDIAVGFGGYVSFPVLLLAKMMGIRTLMHEQNFFPGLANRALSYLVDRAAVSFKETTNFFLKKSNVRETGNPVRRDLTVLDRGRALGELGLERHKFTILVMGGSQGAHFINTAMLDILEGMSVLERGRIQCIHLSGVKDHEFVKAGYESFGVDHRVFAFCDDMGLLYSACDAVISRAGATSIAEITLFGRASVLIPYPSVKVHQFENARFMEEREAAVVVEQGDSCAARLSEALRMLMNDPSRLRTLAQNAAKLGRPDAADRLAAEILLTLKKESR